MVKGVRLSLGLRTDRLLFALMIERNGHPFWTRCFLASLIPSKIASHCFNASTAALATIAARKLEGFSGLPQSDGQPKNKKMKLQKNRG